jgi:hypothetical protein
VPSKAAIMKECCTTTACDRNCELHNAEISTELNERDQVMQKNELLPID